jgi:ACS family sodium-dependent inorganic phosphate cotransporter
LTALIAARIGMGLGEAAMFPAATELFSRWVPAGERTRAMARLLSGIPLGTLIGLMVTGWIIGRYAWPMAFYSFGVLGLLWVAVWFWWVSNDPASDPRISQAERTLLAPLQVPTGIANPTPWGKLLRHGPMWSMVVAHFATTWNLYVLLSWLPSYFREVQGLSIANAGLFSAAPWLAMFLVTNVSASISDRLVQRGVSLTRVRKIIQCTGLLGPAIFLLALRDVHSPSLALLLLCCATGALGCTWSGYAPNPLDMSPRHAGVIMGLSNTFATIPGIVGVALTGWLIDVTGTYTAAFLLTAAISAVGALIYGLFFNAAPIEN